MPVTLIKQEAGLVPGVIIENDGYAVPAGIECPIEYNGMTMNLRSEPEHIRILSIDGLYDADIRSAVESNPDDHGEIDIDGPLYGGRTLVLNGVVVARSFRTMRGMMQAIRTATNDLMPHPLVFDVDNIVYNHQIVCRKVSLLGTEEQGNSLNWHRNFQLTLRAQNPRFTSVYEYVQSINLNQTTELTVNNIGNFPATSRVVVSGYAEDASFKNLATGNYVHVNGSISSGDSWTFDMERLGIRVTDKSGQNKYDALDPDATRMLIAKGPNTIKMDAAANRFGPDAKLSVYWRNSWL